MRDAVKGHYTDAADRGFATGKPGLEETVKIGIVAATDHPQVDYSKGANSKKPYASSPQQVVNYVSCHDDLMLTDKLRKSMPEASDSARMRAARLAQAIVFTSQGTPFIFAGEEIFRDKKGVHNSYCSPDSINAIDWNLKSDNLEQFKYYQGLIALRKAIPAFRMATAAEIAKNLHFEKVDNTKQPNLIYYTLTGDPEWKEIRVVLNGVADSQSVKIPGGQWTVLAFDNQIYPEGSPQKIKGGMVDVPGTSAMIIAR